MNYYSLVEKDQPQSSWAIHTRTKPLPKHRRRPELPPVIYRFFGPTPDGEMCMKPEYHELVCKSCGRYDDDPVFEVGFSDPVLIRIRGDFASTEDRVYAVSQKFLEVLRKARVRGYETKPLGSSCWHAFRVTKRVECDESVMEFIEPFCHDCMRPARTPGAFEHVRQVSAPQDWNTFFTTEKGWAKPFRNRDIFLTEDVMETLRAGGVTGGWCTRLWTDEELCIGQEKAKRGLKWKPPGWCVSLNGSTKKRTPK